MRSRARGRWRANSAAIRRYLKENKLSQHELADRAGLSASVVARFADQGFRYVTKTFEGDTFDKLAKATGIPVEELKLQHNGLPGDKIVVVQRLRRRLVDEHARLHDLQDYEPIMRRAIATKIENRRNQATLEINQLRQYLGQNVITWEPVVDDIASIWKRDDEAHLASIPYREDFENCDRHFDIGDACQAAWLNRVQQEHRSLNSAEARRYLLAWIGGFLEPTFAYHDLVIEQLRTRHMNVKLLEKPLEDHVSLLASLAQITDPIQLP